MNRTGRILLLLLTWLLARPLQAYDLTKPDAIEFAQFDAPTPLVKWLEQELPRIDRQRRFDEWITGFVSLLRFGGHSETFPFGPEDLLFAETEAFQRQRFREYLFVKRSRLTQESRKGGMEAQTAAYKRIIEEARQLKQRGVELLATTELAWLLMDTGNLKEGLQHLQSLPKSLPEGSAIGPYDWLEIVQNCVTILPPRASMDQSMTLYRDILKTVEAARPRYFLASVKANLALLLMRMESPPADLNPEKLLREAVAVATEIEEPMTMGTSMSGLAVALFRAKRYEESQAYYQKALKIFETLKDDIWIADTYKKMARLQVATGNFKAALALVDKAQKTFTRDYRSDHIEILDLRRKAEAGLGNEREAYLVLRAHQKLYQQSLAANEEHEVTSRLVSNQVDLEQSRNKALAAEAMAKQKKTVAEGLLQEITSGQHKNLGIFIRGAGILFLFIVGLAICARFLHQRNHDVHVHIRENLLQRFVPPTLAHAIAAGEKHIEKDPQRFEITVVFARIVQFDELIQKLGPSQLAETLGPFLDAMSEVIFAHGGTIDKFNRGTLMILFGAPLAMDDQSQVRAATRCAEAMILRLHEMRGTRLQLAIGIHHGPALVGFFGGEQRMDYTAIGATVNMASRIEGLAAPGDIVVSEIIALILKDDEYRLMGHFLLKGIELHQALYIWVQHGQQEAVS